MHLGNGAITPECGLFALGAAATSTAIALVVARSKPLDRSAVFTAAALGAAVFAAQMFNVQVLPFSSVHLIGGVLLAWTLGPPLGVMLMTSVLALEAALLGDGGFLALGVNAINMAVVPALFVAAARRFSKNNGAVRSATVLGIVSFLATMAGAGLVVAEVAVGRNAAQLAGWSEFAGQMLGTHAIFGTLEAVVTVAIVTLLGGLGHPAGRPLALPRSWSAGVTALAIVVALLSSPTFGLASGAPDGYESAVAVAKAGGSPLGHLESAEKAGQFNAAVQSWQDNIVARLPSSHTTRTLFSTLVVSAAAGGLALACSRRRGSLIA
jgi:cobalt/nickel transport system permease protein